MIFVKDYGELTNKALEYLISRTNITNQTVGGIARSLIEVINMNIAEYYDILDINTAMGFVSTAQGFFLDLIGDLFNIRRLAPASASAEANDRIQLFYVVSGTLHDVIPTNTIPYGTTVTTADGSLVYTVTSDVTFNDSDTQVYVPVQAAQTGTSYNVGVNTLVRHSLGVANVFTTNNAVISGGTDVESDNNFRYRIVNASLSAEKANETAVRLACLSVPGVANVVMKPYARGIGTFDVIVIPVEGIATDQLVATVQGAINGVQAFGNTGYAIKPDIVPVDISVRLVFTDTTTDVQREDIAAQVVTAIEKYIVNIPLGGTFVYNALIQTVLNVNKNIKNLAVTCYNFREEPAFRSDVTIFWNELFYPNSSSAQAVQVK